MGVGSQCLLKLFLERTQHEGERLVGRRRVQRAFRLQNIAQFGFLTAGHAFRRRDGELARVLFQGIKHRALFLFR